MTFRNMLSNQHGGAVFSYENAALIVSLPARTDPPGRGVVGQPAWLRARVLDVTGVDLAAPSDDPPPSV